MTLPLLALAVVLGASAQSTGQMSPTSDVSANRVKATGSTTARALKDRAADVVNVKDFGAVGDGTTDDTTAIQAALTASAGKTVRLTDGATYKVSASLLPLSGTRVTGQARLKAVTSGIVTAMFDLDNVTSVTIQDVEIDGSTNAGGTVGGKFGIRVTGGRSNRIVGALIHDTWGDGIKIDGGRDHAVFGGSVVDCGRPSTTEDQGIAVMAVTSDLSAVRVSGVHVARPNRKGIATYADLAGGFTLSDVVINGNTVESAPLGGIFVGVQPTAAQVLGVSVTGNVVSDSYVGIEVASATGAAVTGNSIRNSTHFGMDVSGVIGGSIIGNTIDSSAIHGIHVSDSAGTTRNLVISGNVVTNSNTTEQANGYGIQLNNATYSIVANNIVTDHDASPTPSHGIVEDGTSDYNEFVDNIVTGTATGAARFYSITGANSITRIAGTPDAVGFTPENASTVVPDTRVTQTFTYTAETGVSAFEILAPTSRVLGQRIAITVRNTSGGALTVTWDAIYKVAWTDPANGKRRTAVFVWDGTNWVHETMHADAPS